MYDFAVGHLHHDDFLTELNIEAATAIEHTPEQTEAIASAVDWAEAKVAELESAFPGSLYWAFLQEGDKARPRVRVVYRTLDGVSSDAVFEPPVPEAVQPITSWPLPGTTGTTANRPVAEAETVTQSNPFEVRTDFYSSINDATPAIEQADE